MANAMPFLRVSKNPLFLLGENKGLGIFWTE